MRQRQRRGRKAPRKIRIVGEIDRQHRQRRRRRRAEHQRHVDRRQRVGERGIDRQADQPVEPRGDQLEPGDARLVAEAGADAEHARRIELAERGQAGEEQERHFLQHQPGGEAEAPAIVRHQQVGRRFDRQRQRRDPHQPARGRQQEGKAEGEGRMRRRQQPGQHFRRDARQAGAAHRPARSTPAPAAQGRARPAARRRRRSGWRARRRRAPDRRAGRATAAARRSRHPAPGSSRKPAAARTAGRRNSTRHATSSSQAIGAERRSNRLETVGRTVHRALSPLLRESYAARKRASLGELNEGAAPRRRA